MLRQVCCDTTANTFLLGKFTVVCFHLSGFFLKNSFTSLVMSIFVTEREDINNMSSDSTVTWEMLTSSFSSWHLVVKRFVGVADCWRRYYSGSGLWMS